MMPAIPHPSLITISVVSSPITIDDDALLIPPLLLLLLLLRHVHNKIALRARNLESFGNCISYYQSSSDSIISQHYFFFRIIHHENIFFLIESINNITSSFIVIGSQYGTKSRIGA